MTQYPDVPFHSTPRPAPPPTLASGREPMRRELSRLRPFENADDVNRWNEGREALHAPPLSRAEQAYKKRILAQPEYFDGDNGLARADPGWARRFAGEPVRLGAVFLDDGSLDPEGRAEMPTFRFPLDTEAPPGPLAGSAKAARMGDGCGRPFIFLGSNERDLTQRARMLTA